MGCYQSCDQSEPTHKEWLSISHETTMNLNLFHPQSYLQEFKVIAFPSYLKTKCTMPTNHDNPL